MPAPQSRYRQPKQLDAAGFQPEISSFRLHLAAEGKAAKTVRTCTEAVAWFAAAHLRRETDLTSWEEVGKQDIQRWIVRLLDWYSSAYASNQYRALQQFFKWLAAEEEILDPMAGLKPPGVPDKPVPVFAAGDLPRLERARAFAERRDAALIAVFRATGIRLSELAGIRYDAEGPGRSDVDLRHREITVQGKGRKTRTVKISFDAARSLDRYLRVRARHAQAYRPQLWLGASNRGPDDSQRDLPGHRPRAAASAASTCTRTGSGTTSATPGSTGAAPRATSWSSTAGPPRRCSAATAPAPAAPGPAAATTASWRTRPDLSPPGPSLQGCLLRQGIPPGRNIRSFRTSWRAAKTGRPSRENGCSVTSRRSACPGQDRCPAAPSTSSA